MNIVSSGDKIKIRNHIDNEQKVITIKKYINQQDMKRTNASEVFRLILENGPITRQQLGTMTGLSWGAISNITARLLAGQYVVEAKPQSVERTGMQSNETARQQGNEKEKPQNSRGSGRKANHLEVNSEEYFIIGLDINCSGFKGVVVNLKNEIIDSWAKNVIFDGKQQLLDQIAAFAKDSMSRAQGHRILGIGIAMQGQVNAAAGISIQFPHCRDWENVPLAEILAQELGLPVFLEHDPDCILYAEAIRKRKEKAILIRADQGIGMAVMLDGKILNSPGMFEIGHMCVEPEGILCDCGKRGCLECYASQKGMAGYAGMSFEELAEQAYRKVPAALHMFEKMADYLACAVSFAAQLLNVSDIVLCGDMFRYRELFWDRFQNRAEQMLLPALKAEFTCIEVEKAALGAAFIAIDHSVEAIMVE